MKNGLSSNKLILGIPLYGKGFILANTLNNYIGAPALGPTTKSVYANESGIVPYYEVYILKMKIF